MDNSDGGIPHKQCSRSGESTRRSMLLKVAARAAMETLGFLELSNLDIADDLPSGADDPRCVGFFVGNRLPDVL